MKNLILDKVCCIGCCVVVVVLVVFVVAVVIVVFVDVFVFVFEISAVFVAVVFEMSALAAVLNVVVEVTALIFVSGILDSLPRNANFAILDIDCGNVPANPPKTLDVSCPVWP